MKVEPELPIRDKENKRKDKKVRLNESEEAVVRRNADKYEMDFGVYLREVAYNPLKFPKPAHGKKASPAPLPKGNPVNRVTFKDRLIDLNHEMTDCVGKADKVNIYEDDGTVIMEATEFVLTFVRKDILIREQQGLD